MADFILAPMVARQTNSARCAFKTTSRRYATGSTLIEWGNTRVICGVTVEETVPRWMKEQKVDRRLDHRRIFDAPLLHPGTQTARHLQGQD